MVPMVPWIASIFVHKDETGMDLRNSLWWIAFLLDLAMIMVGLLLEQWTRKRFRFRLGFNIEHFVERLGLFTLIVFGQLITCVLWSSTAGGFSTQYQSGLFGMAITICFQVTYYLLIDGHGGNFIHPLHRGSGLATVWTFLHLPLHAAIILGGSAMGILTKLRNGEHVVAISQMLQISDPFALQRMTCVSFALAYLVFALMSLTYQTRDEGAGVPCLELPPSLSDGRPAAYEAGDDGSGGTSAVASAAEPPRTTKPTHALTVLESLRNRFSFDHANRLLGRDTPSPDHPLEELSRVLVRSSSLQAQAQMHVAPAPALVPQEQSFAQTPGAVRGAGDGAGIPRRHPLGREESRSSVATKTTIVPPRPAHKKAQPPPRIPKLARIISRLLVFFALMFVAYVCAGIDAYWMVGLVALIMVCNTVFEEFGRHSRATPKTLLTKQ